MTPMEQLSSYVRCLLQSGRLPERKPGINRPIIQDMPPRKMAPFCNGAKSGRKSTFVDARSTDEAPKCSSYPQRRASRRTSFAKMHSPQDAIAVMTPSPVWG
jgi:hypothetical protein